MRRSYLIAGALALILHAPVVRAQTVLPPTGTAGPGTSNNYSNDETGARGVDDTARNDTQRMYAASVGGAVVVGCPPSGAITIALQPTAAVTMSFSGCKANLAQPIMIAILQGGTGYAVTLPAASATFRYSGGTAPTISTTANSVTMLRAVYLNGTWVVG